LIGDQLKLRDWENFGLPGDEKSHDNSIFVSNSYRWPLIIDPQLQGRNWIRNMESKNELNCLKMN
jgi:dynein heavy chain